ncbi:MAG: hypothetical protein P8H96_10205 [Akkermansiaceae bacterium]|nr:hypothetical protein [Akkermansiaceae bacterium]
MKEIFRLRVLHQVTRSRDVLENVGIETLLLNENLSVTDAFFSEFFPNLCILNDEKFSKGVKLLGEHGEKMGKGAEVQVRRPSCGEMNPGDFDVLFSCHEPINQSMPC